MTEELDRESFFELAMTNDLPDVMDFRLDGNDDPERGFSVEGHEAIGYQIHDWLIARTLAYYRRHGRMPKALKATISVSWDEVVSDDDLAEGNPWFQADDPGTTRITADGSHRFSTFIEERRRRSE